MRYEDLPWENLQSVEKVPRSGEIKGNPGLAASLNGLVIADRSARLNDRFDVGVKKYLGAVGEGEEGIGSSYRPGSSVPSPLHRKTAGIDAIDLAHTNAN